MLRETIAAKATPSGRGGVGIVRISGDAALQIASKILQKPLKPRIAEYRSFFNANGEVIDNGLVLFFKAPHSFTGEDVLELQGHGGPVVMDLLLNEILSLGARLARPGEFTERAFLNNKIDLLQAEAIADLIDASSIQAAKSAVRSLQGEFSCFVNELLSSLIKLRMHVEAAIDFPDEALDFLNEGKVHAELKTIIGKSEHLLAKANEGVAISRGLSFVIAGKPNAGKSSLLNALAGYDAAIVTDIPGTTRDVLREDIDMDGLLFRISDTAGLRLAEDRVEEEGIKRALNECKLADHVMLMIDGREIAENQLSLDFVEKYHPEFKERPLTLLYNKIDILNLAPKVISHEKHTVIYLSAKTGEGIDLLKAHLKKMVNFATNENTFIARMRHVEALKIVRQHLLGAKQQLLSAKAFELMAEELRQAQMYLDTLTGKFTADALLGKIFSEFCIGK